MGNVDGVVRCSASYEKGQARAVVSEGKFEAESLVEAIESVGFSAYRVEE
jgi:copper chaperone CopZ